MNRKIQLQRTRCALCGDFDHYKILYKRNFTLSDLNKDVFSARRLPDKSHYQMVQCLQDGLVRSNPIANTQILTSLYRESLFNYEDEVDYLTKTYMDALENVLPKLRKRDRILEIGCGNGFVLDALYKKGFINVFGVEPSSDSIKRAPAYLRKKIKNDIFKKGLMKKQKFRLICFFQTLDHIPDPNSFLQLCFDLLESSGYILAFNHNIASFSANVLKEKSPIIDIEHTYLYTPKTIKELFQKNKFTIHSVVSVRNTLSLKHFFWLLPLPKYIKLKLLRSQNELLHKRITLQLGNLCLIAQKLQ